MLILAVVVGAWAVGGGLHPARADSLTEKDLLARAREFSRLRNVDASLGTETTGYISHLHYLQMHNNQVPPGSPLHTQSPVFVYRVFGDWTGILNYGGPFDAEVFEVAFNAQTGAVLLTTTYANAEQVPDLTVAANVPLREPAPFPTSVPAP
jgi:hypothetical protein